MIAYLKGDFIQKTPAAVIVDVGGVGYEVNISLHTFSHIQSHEKGILFTHLLIREDAHILYGFADLKEKEMFLALISVSGIGAGTARIILSYMKPDELAAAIMRGDSQSLERIKGIGKKTAERAVLELKDKLGKKTISIDVPIQHEPSIRQDAIEALIALGIQRAHAETSVQRTLQDNPSTVLEDVIKQVLKNL